MAEMIKNEAFELQLNVEANGDIEKVLQTKDTYVDRNIKVKVSTPDAVLEAKEAGAITATVSTTDKVYTSDTPTAYAIEIAADAHVDASKVGVKTAGFAASDDEVVIAAADATQDTKTLYIKAGTLAAEGSASAEGHGITLGSKLNAAPESGFYVKASAAGSANIATAGWVDPEKTQSVSTNGDAYYSIAEVTFANTATGEYKEVQAPALISGGYLYISEGYTEAVKLALADLVPDQATVVAGDNKFIYNTVSVYDKDGNLITGSMGDATLGEITANDAAAEITSVNVVATDGAFKVSGSKAIAGSASVAIASEGYATTSLSKEGAISGTASVNATLATIGIGVEVEDNDVEVAPQIKKESSTALSGAITTSQPTGKYIAVSADAIEASVTVNPVVNTAGYGNGDIADKTGATVKAGSAATGTYYIPVTSGNHAISIAEPTVENASATVTSGVVSSTGADLTAGVLNAAPSGDYLTISATAAPTKGSVSVVADCKVTEGYVTADATQATKSADVTVSVTNAADKYIRIYDGSIL